jgi:hypothetical protein
MVEVRNGERDSQLADICHVRFPAEPDPLPLTLETVAPSLAPAASTGRE